MLAYYYNTPNSWFSVDGAKSIILSVEYGGIHSWGTTFGCLMEKGLF